MFLNTTCKSLKPQKFFFCLEEKKQRIILIRMKLSYLSFSLKSSTCPVH